MKKIKKGISSFLALLMVVGLIPFVALEADAALPSNLTISQTGIDFIKDQEGFSATCYRDSVQSSIGYGTRCGTDMHDSGLHTITEPAAEAAMKAMLEDTFIPAVRRQMADVPMNQSQFDALVSLAYNTGGGSSIIKNSPLAKYLAGELTEAKARSLYAEYYIRSGDQIVEGLVDRRNAEAALFFSESLVRETYLCYGQLTITAKSANIYNRPYSTKTAADSVVLETAKKDATYTAIGLVRNSATVAGDLWYKVTTKSGDTGYIYSGNTKYTQLTDDLSISGVVAPAQVQLGNSFSIKGIIKAKYQTLSSVGVEISTLGGEHVTGGTENVDALSYSLYNSSVDAKTQFGAITKEGSYWYVIFATVRSCYAKSGTEVGEAISKTATLYNTEFSVKKTVPGGSISVHTCDWAIYQRETLAHPHNSCYECSICGAVKEYPDQPNYKETCTTCNPDFAGAKIKTQPKTAVAPKGKTATVSLSATGEGLTYAWYYKNAGSSKFSKTTTFTGNSYYITMDADRDGRQVYCVVTDQYGNSVKSNTVSLIMGNPAQITQQPKSVTADPGATAKVIVSASGDGLTYTWYFKNKGASAFSKTTSFTGNSYSVKMDTSRHGRQVYCVVKDKYGNSVKTETVTLSMAGTAKITQQPQSVKVAKDASAKVSFKATGDGLTYTWYFKNKGATSFSKTTSFSGNSYYITMDATRDGRQVYCVVKDKYGNTEKTATVTLSMAEAVKITKQPQSVTAHKGAMAKVSLAADGDGLTYTWYYKNAGSSKFIKTTSFTGSSYYVTMDAARDGRQVYCVVKDQYGHSVKSETVTLTMAKTAKITQEPRSVTAAKGASAKVSFTATGDGLTYTWYFKNKGATSFAKTTSFTGNSYAVTMDAARDGRQVYCVVKDKYGNAVGTDVVTLSMSK